MEGGPKPRHICTCTYNTHKAILSFSLVTKGNTKRKAVLHSNPLHTYYFFVMSHAPSMWHAID